MKVKDIAKIIQDILLSIEKLVNAVKKLLKKSRNVAL